MDATAPRTNAKTKVATGDVERGFVRRIQNPKIWARTSALTKSHPCRFPLIQKPRLTPRLTMKAVVNNALLESGSHQMLVELLSYRRRVLFGKIFRECRHDRQANLHSIIIIDVIIF